MQWGPVMINNHFSREELLNIIETDHVQCGEASALARIALYTMDSEPVAWDYEWASCITCEGPQDFNRVIEREAPPEWAINEGQARNVIPLYRHAQQPVAHIPVLYKGAELLSRSGLELIRDGASFATDLESACMAEALLAAAQPAPVVPEERPSLNNGIVGFDEGWNACRAAMLAAAPQEVK